MSLESRLGVRLVQRTSRSFRMNDVGRDFYQHARAVLIEAETADHVVTRRLAEPSGIVRFTCSAEVAAAMSGLLAQFVRQYPKVSLVQHATNKYVDLIEEGFDVGLRGHDTELADSDLIQRRLSPTPWRLLASPAYLNQAETLRHPSELVSHTAIAHGTAQEVAVWKLRHVNGEDIDVLIAPRLWSDSLEAQKMSAITGLGIVALPRYFAQAELREQKLLHVLPEWVAHPDAAVTLLTPSRRGQLPAVRAFVEFLVDEFPRMVSGENSESYISKILDFRGLK